MQSRIVLFLLLTTSLMTFMALPAVADDAAAPFGNQSDIAQLRSAPPHVAGEADYGRNATTLLPDERDEPMRVLVLVGPAVLITVLTVFGLTITFRELRRDMRLRRVVYRQRGPRQCDNHGASRHPRC